MNIVPAIAKREKGLQFNKDYDVALLRLKCHEKDIYKGISPNTEAPDFNAEPPVFACRFSPKPGYEDIIALANEDGKIALQNTKVTVDHDPDKPLEGTQAHSDAIFDLAWMPQEMKLITASGDHSARLWDVTESTIKMSRIFCGHTRSIKSVVFRHEDKAVFATGARDGAIMIWDIRANYNLQPKPDNTIYNAHCADYSSRPRFHKNPRLQARNNQPQSITGLVFQDDNTLISCSTGDGMIKAWDLRKYYGTLKKEPMAKHIMHYGGKSNRNGFTSLLMCPAGITLYASCMDNTIYSYNMSSYASKPVAEYFGHRNLTFYVKACLSPDGKYLASGSSDESAYIWHTKRPGTPLLKLSGHREEVTCVAWCSLGEPKLITCSDDSYHRIWRVGKEHFSDDEQINLRGTAEAVSLFLEKPMEVSMLETTPTVTRPRTNKDYSSGSDITPGNTPNLNGLEDSQNNAGSVKRSHAQMSDDYWSEDYKSILSPIQENFEAPAKRPNIDNRGARRLFSPGNKIDRPEKQSPNGYESDGPGPSRSRKLDMGTPFSPTSNLPNFVIDGTAPHLLEMSPQKSKENIDWLTKIRKERYAQGNSKSTEKLPGPKNNTTPVRRTSRSKSTEPRKTPKSPATPLLHFLRPSVRDCNNDLCQESTNVASTCHTSEAN
ncbi:protein lethal(2)denticleless [Nasonia vitripennis]|uniref:Protein lethal(2)denticleless n=1 Tax=Nasonia vitripennis TaxID=7425 RepID=A0A7M7G7S2_NASVI|nr:protein lethal(2)denticleless [Nasonia vitripennis]